MRFFHFHQWFYFESKEPQLKMIEYSVYEISRSRICKKCGRREIYLSESIYTHNDLQGYFFFTEDQTPLQEELRQLNLEKLI